MKRLKSPKAKVPQEQVNQEDRFEGNGMMFKCKLFGMVDVPGPRGDDICQDAMLALKQQALKSKKESGSHKQKIFLNLSVKGIRIIDEKTQRMDHGHPIHRISYISHDKDDKRTFGYIVSLKEGYKLFAFRTEKAAALLTANLKALFQVVFQKYKKKQDDGDDPKSQPQQENSAVEQGVEMRENDAFYAVPDKVTLVDAKKSKDTLEPPAPVVANLLDWSDVNDQLEEINQNMKRSDTSELLSGVDDLNFSSAIGDDTQGADAFGADAFGADQGFADPFKADPFFKPDNDGFTSDERTIRSSASDSDIKHLTNPFLSAGNADPFAPGESPSISKSKSLEIFSVDRNTQGSPQADQDLFGGQPFTNPDAQPPARATNMDDLFSLQTSDTSFNSPVMTVTDSSTEQFNAAPIDQVCLEPSRDGESGGSDPFSLLSGDIQGMKGTLPSGKEALAFPQQKSRVTPQGAPLRVASGPTIPPQGLSGNNPFLSQGQNPYSTPQNGPFPSIPPRVDLFAQGQQNQMGMQRPASPYGAQQNPMFQGSGQANWGNFGGNPAMMNQMGSTNQYPPAIPGRPDLAFGGGAQPTSTDGMYATVNKPPPQRQNNGTTAPGKDPFGDLADFGF